METDGSAFSNHTHRQLNESHWCAQPGCEMMQCIRCELWFDDLYAGGYCEGCLEAIGPDAMACDLDTD